MIGAIVLALAALIPPAQTDGGPGRAPDAARRYPYAAIRPNADGTATLLIGRYIRPRDIAALRRSSPVRMVVRFDDPRVRKPPNERACYLRARVVRSERGDVLRRGDTVEFRIGCGSANQNPFNVLVPSAFLRAGARGRLYLDGDALEARSFEPL
jgi:hypothetical protein